MHKCSSQRAFSRFLDNLKRIKDFNSMYYSNRLPKVVLCGINPGRFGAGKTGIPFIDFNSLSQMIDNIHENDSENSATFFYQVISEIGVKRFYETFYVTNLSWVGYSKSEKNFNYYQLSPPVKQFIYEMFKKEMEIVSPKTIISLGNEVKKSINTIFSDTGIDISNKLPHPSYCAMYNNKQKCKDKYIELLKKYL